MTKKKWNQSFSTVYSLLSIRQWDNGGLCMCAVVCIANVRITCEKKQKNNLHNMGVMKRAKIVCEGEREKKLWFSLVSCFVFSNGWTRTFPVHCLSPPLFSRFQSLFCSLSSMPFRRKVNARSVYFGERNSRMWHMDEQEPHFAFYFGSRWQMHFVFTFTRFLSNKWKENSYDPPHTTAKQVHV